MRCGLALVRFGSEFGMTVDFVADCIAYSIYYPSLHFDLLHLTGGSTILLGLTLSEIDLVGLRITTLVIIPIIFLLCFGKT